MSLVGKLSAAAALIAAAAASQAIADAEAIDCTSGKCVQAEPATPGTPMRPKAPGALPGATLTPSKGQGGLSLKSGARVQRQQGGGSIEIRGGRSYSCKDGQCDDAGK